MRKQAEGPTPKVESTLTRITRAAKSFLNPKAYFHVFRIIHYYGYSHVIPRATVSMGKGTRIAPNVSFYSGKNISIGKECHIGAKCYIWAGEDTGKITIGNYVSLAPEVFITASNYSFEKGKPFRKQPKIEQSVNIGDDVWLGARVTVTAGLTIGEGCIVGAGAVVTKDLPPNSIAVGVPAKVVGLRQESTEGLGTPRNESTTIE